VPCRHNALVNVVVTAVDNNQGRINTSTSAEETTMPQIVKTHNARTLNGRSSEARQRNRCHRSRNHGAIIWIFRSSDSPDPETTPCNDEVRAIRPDEDQPYQPSFAASSGNDRATSGRCGIPMICAVANA